MNKKYFFKDIVDQKSGFLRGPFGGSLKKEIFVEKTDDTYKVYEQGVVLNKDESIGRYYISKEYFDTAMYRFETKEKDFLVSCSGVNYGAIYQLKKGAEKGVINQALLRIRLNNNIIDDSYFNYYFNTILVKKIIGGTGDSTIPNFPPMNFIKNIEIEIPDLRVQKSIGEILSDLDAKIELNNKINAELEAMAKLIYDYWFVQFEFPDKNGKPYKSSGGKMVWNEELKREVPEGWVVDKLSSWIEKDKSGDWGKEEREGKYTERVFCIRGADLNGLNGSGSVKAPERFILEKNSHKILDPHDLIVEISGGSPTQSTGRMAYITEDTLKRFDAPIICSNFCKAVTLKEEAYLFNFSFVWNNAYDQGILFGYEGKTSGIKNLLFDSFVTSYNTIIPPKNLAEKFYEFMTPMESRKQKNLLENKQLAELRDWLLPMLMNGQVRVENKGEYKMNEKMGMAAEEQTKYNS